ncbi:MAG: toprim domain-containing protein [Candidatus Eremiobacteraeota bacterium]|nr:toprim domain-containing protein [Candidatus Eremiobacteraeota bacterium]
MADLEELKSRISLKDLMEGSGIPLRRVGKNLVAQCPWHEDHEASLVVNPNKQLFNCFGCEAGGDALNFLQLHEKLSFPQAVARLQELTGEPTQKSPVQKPKVTASDQRDRLFKRVAEIYSDSLLRSEEARKYLDSRCLGSTELREAFQLGYADGSLLAMLPNQGGVREELTELGLLNEKGRELFLGCVVVPLYHPDEGLVGFYGRKLDPKDKIQHLYLPGPRRGVFHWECLESERAVYLMESVFDALSAWSAGVRNVTCVFGVQGVPRDLEALFKRYGVQEVRLCLDADPAGEKATQKLTEALQERFRVCRVLLPEGSDPNDILVRDGPQVLASFLQCVKDPEKEPLPDCTVEDQDDHFLVQFEELAYRVTPRPPFNGLLRVMLRVQLLTTGKRFLENLDLTSSKQRTALVRQLAQTFGLSKPLIEDQVQKLTELMESWVEKQLAAEETATQAAPVMTPADEEEALEFLGRPDLVQAVLQDMENLGYVGEKRGKLLAYLIGISRKLENPLSGIILSQSGAGKSGLSSVVAQLTPPEEVVRYTRVTTHALAYHGEHYLERKLLLLEERVGGEAADYHIRVLQSSHELRQAVVVKDPVTGKMKTQEFLVRGPIAYLETTTDPKLNHENATRCFEIHLDETEEQTARIQERQRAFRKLEVFRETPAQKTICRRHHNAQRLLRQVKVLIPFVDELTFPTRWLRTRRDNERFLCLVEAVAFLHQFQRRQGTVNGPNGETRPYIEATVEDYRLAYELAGKVLCETLHELSTAAQELFEKAQGLLAERLADKGKTSFTRRELRYRTGWPDRQLRAAVEELVEMEYLVVYAGSQGRTYRYGIAQVDEAAPAVSPLRHLLSPGELARRLEVPDDS